MPPYVRPRKWSSDIREDAAAEMGRASGWPALPSADALWQGAGAVVVTTGAGLGVGGVAAGAIVVAREGETVTADEEGDTPVTGENRPGAAPPVGT